MKLWNLSKSLVPVLLFALVFSACEKEEIDNSDQDYPIELSLSKPDRNIILEWTKTNISNFDGYFLVRSTEPIADAPEPIAPFATVDDFEENIFEDASFPLAERVYYKVYVKVGERFLFSPTVSIDFDVNLLDFRATKVVHSSEDNVLFMFDNSLRTIYRYDYELGEITHEFNQPNNFNYVMAVGDAGQGTELFLAANNSATVKIYDADDFTWKESFTHGGFVSSIDVKDDAIAISTDNFSQPLVILRRSPIGVIDDVDGAVGFDRRIKFLPGNDREMVDASFEQVLYYRFDENWALQEINSANFFSNPLVEIVVSPDGEHFIHSLEGFVMNKNLDIVGTVPVVNFSFFQDYIFSEEGDELFAFQVFPGQVQQFSFPDLELEETLDLNYQLVRAFQANDGRMVIVGLVQVGFEVKTIVDVFRF